jgi:hypothetical protein
MLQHSNSANELLLRRKLEQQQAIELQSHRPSVARSQVTRRCCGSNMVSNAPAGRQRIHLQPARLRQHGRVATSRVWYASRHPTAGLFLQMKLPGKLN